MKTTYRWQRQATIKTWEKDSIISAPTGAGKTRVAIKWATTNMENYEKIIFTAPIKALSYQRFKDLKKVYKKDVGLITGDITINQNAKVLCMTQEIYTKHYINNIVKLVMDEFHYINQNSDRSRAYIDALVFSKKDSKILLLSATFGDSKRFQEYIQRISSRKFVLYETEFRATKLNFCGEIDEENVKNALVFATNMYYLSQGLADITSAREELEESKINKIRKLAKAANVNFKAEWAYGVASYYGKLLPKEKLFVENLYIKGLIDVLIGTSALAMGVNLPAENVVFLDFSNRYRDMSKNEFLQMAGRAGRKDYYNEGNIYFIDNGYENDEEYEALLEAKPENMNIQVQMDFKKILRSDFDQGVINKEIQYVNRVSGILLKDLESEVANFKDWYECKLEDLTEAIKEPSESVYKNIESSFTIKEFTSILKMMYCEEFDISQNFLNAIEVLNLSKNKERDLSTDDIYEMLRIYKYFKKVPSKFRTIQYHNMMKSLKKDIITIDATVFDVA